MIGKPEWFKYRIFGWGIAPKTWQGWLYIGVWMLILIIATIVTAQNAISGWVLGILLGLLILDTLHIMTKLSKVSDERENYHQLIIERNCSFAAITSLVILALYQSYNNKTILLASEFLPFDIYIAIVLGVMLLTKIGSTIYVKTKM